MIRFTTILSCILPINVLATSVSSGLSDPDIQPKFVTPLPNPLAPSFLYNTSSGYIEVSVNEGVADTGLVGSDGVTPVTTPIWGYGTSELGHTWPGRTFVVREGESLSVKWLNEIPIDNGYLLTGKDNGGQLDFVDDSVVDTSYHWCYKLQGYENYTIESHGTPIVPHLHGASVEAPFDGNPDFFFTPGFNIKGPRWPGEIYEYENNQPAACLWYHDHALGITRLNIYAGMAGFYIVRDEIDTGKAGNVKKLPAYPYEWPLLVQDRMFKENGELFYPAYKGDPFYSDYITGEGVTHNAKSPTAMAEMFGDHMLVNGKIWPVAEVEPRNYRLRLLNGCDSRFMVIQFAVIELNQTDFQNATAIDFYVIGGDQGFADSITKTDMLVFEPGARYDVIVNFTNYDGSRIIMRNWGGDEPFGGDIPGPTLYNDTDKVMAFDVIVPFDTSIPDEFVYEDPVVSQSEEVQPDRVRRVGLFEGRDQYNRLQPLLGTIDPATDMNGDPIYWPDDDMYLMAGLTGQMEGTMTWHAPTTENIKLNDVEEWEIWNLSADAHPIHLHLVNFRIVGRKEIIFDSGASEEGEIDSTMTASGDGTYISAMPLVQSDGTVGKGYKVMNPTSGDDVQISSVYVSNFPRDMVVALPKQVTTIRVQFDREGTFNWHCHILSHEDHEMMRIFYVGQMPEYQLGGDGSGISSPSLIVSMVLALVCITTGFL